MCVVNMCGSFNVSLSLCNCTILCRSGHTAESLFFMWSHALVVSCKYVLTLFGTDCGAQSTVFQTQTESTEKIMHFFLNQN